MASNNVVDREELRLEVEKLMANSQERVLSKDISESEAMYERGKYALAKELKRIFKL